MLCDRHVGHIVVGIQVDRCEDNALDAKHGPLWWGRHSFDEMVRAGADAEVNHKREGNFT